MNKLFGYILIIGFILAGCKHQWANEKEEAAFWDQQVIKPSYILMDADKSPWRALQVFDSLKEQTGYHSPFIDAARFTLISDYYFYFSNENETISRYNDSALAVFNTDQLRKKYPQAYIGRLLQGGTINFRLGNYTRSNNMYFQAKQMADQYLAPCDRAAFTYSVAMIAYRQQNFQQSAKYFKEAYASQATCRVQTGAVILQQQEIQSNIGLCYLHLKQYDSALVYFNNTLKIARENKDSIYPRTREIIEGLEYGNIGKVYAAKNRFQEAEDLFKKSIAINAQPGFELKDAMLVQEHLAEVYLKQKRYDEMFATLQSVQSALDTIYDTEIELGWQKLMFQYYQETGHPLKELQHFKSYTALKDSMEERLKQMVDADVARQLKEKEQALQIGVLKKNNQLANIYLWVAIGFAIMAGVIIFLINQNYRRSKASVEALKQLNDQVNRQKEELEKAIHEKDRILFVVAHDLRNPIGITAYVADLILMEDLDEKERSSLQMIKNASSQALTLTNELLELQQGRGEKVFEKVDFTSVVNHSVDMLRYKAEEKGQQVTIQGVDHPIIVNGQMERLNRMVSNLLVNAIKFSRQQGNINICLQKENENVKLTVADEGVGIPQAQQPLVFKRFTDARQTGTAGEKSVGLGLSIAKEIAEEHKGKIWFTSQEGKGATFFVALPLAEDM